MANEKVTGSTYSLDTKDPKSPKICINIMQQRTQMKASKIKTLFKEPH